MTFGHKQGGGQCSHTMCRLIGQEANGVKVLLLTASFGDGHNQAAYAVAEGLKARDVRVRVVDYTEWLHPALRSFAKFSLIQGVQKAPILYGMFYRSMSKLHPTSQLQRQLNHLGMAQMKRYLRAFQPAVVASTFPTPNGVLSELRAKGFTTVPFVGILTDYTAHGQWIQDHTDLYCVPTERVLKELEGYKVPSDKIAVTGIPIRSQFAPPRVAELLQNRLDDRANEGFAADRPLVLLMGGGAGVLSDVSEWITLLETVDLQFVVICGRNERLYKKLKYLESNRIRVLGYTNEVNRWMAMADIIITKPGGITVTEALAMQLPMLLFRPIPGQEEKNASFAIKAGAARLAQSVGEAGELLKGFRSSPATLAEMREATKQVSLGGAADRIADLLVQMGSKSKASARNNDAWAT